MLIYKTYKTKSGAERYKKRLLKTYESVDIVDTPTTESGVYVFETNKKFVI